MNHKDVNMYSQDLTSKLYRLNSFLQDQDVSHMYRGSSVIDVVIDVITKQREEILGLENTIKAMKSEIEYAMFSDKSDDVKRHYLTNAIRYADEATYIK